FSDGVLQGWLQLNTPIKEGVWVGSTLVQSKPDDVSTHKAGDDASHVAHETDEDSDDCQGGQCYASSQTDSGEIDWKVGCRPNEAYANAKLALLVFSHELERQLRSSHESEGVVSHAINPNTVMSDFFKKGTISTAPTGRSSPMSYLPPVWIAGKVFGFLNGLMSSAMMRSVEHAAKGVLHVATSQQVGGAGGGLFDDMETAFVSCGRAAHACGRVPRAWQPPVAFDQQAAAQLWRLSESLVSGYDDR
ncbi:unnamed protein product, partial [Polarella glacialis]